MKAVAYLRCSTQEQAASGLGIADQRQRIEAYAAMRGLELVDIIPDEGVSGGRAIADRPGGARLLAALKAKRAECVVVLKLDRLFRCASDCLSTVESWDQKNIGLHICDLGGSAVDTRSAMGKFFLTVMAGAAELEKNMTADRTRSALGIKRQRNERISGHAPFGWRFVDTGRVEDGKPVLELEPEPSEAPIVEAIRRLNDGRSLRAISNDLASAGMFSRSGKALSPETVRTVLKRTA